MLKTVPIDPKTIPDLQTGTRDEVKSLEEGVAPEGACYKLSRQLSSQTFTLAGFQGDFGGTKDSSRPTWFSFSVCISRFKGHTNGIFDQTWDQAGRTKPEAIRYDQRRITKHSSISLLDIPFSLATMSVQFLIRQVATRGLRAAILLFVRRLVLLQLFRFFLLPVVVEDLDKKPDQRDGGQKQDRERGDV